MKKYFSITLIFIITCYLFIGCMKQNDGVNNDDYTKDFDSQKAQEISNKYLDLLCEEKIDEASNLLNSELKNNSQGISLGDTKIAAYKTNKVVESSDYAAIAYDVIRVKTDIVRADRDKLIIKVGKEGEEYKVIDIKSSNKNQVYSKGNQLRFMGEEGGDSQLITKTSNLYIDMYPKTKGAMIEKTKIPHDKFGVASISYTGKRVAITTTNGTEHFIAVIDVDEGLVANAPAEDVGNAQESPLKETSEKSIAKKVIPLDVLQVDSINKLVFAADEEKLIVQYIENGKSRIKIYSADSGDLIDVGIDDKFSSSEYFVDFVGLDKKLIKIKVTGRNGEETYTIDLDRKELKKFQK